MINLKELKISVVGLGYVGLPLAVEFSKKFPVLGFDLSVKRIEELNNKIDKTNELSTDVLERVMSKDGNLKISSSQSDISSSNFIIVTVPTPIDDYKVPDLTFIISACEMIGQNLNKNDIVIFESTVFPGATEEVCVPILESQSGLKFNKDFFCGYSPERINPGDKEHTISSVIKVTSGSTPEAAELINKAYSEIINAGTFLASSIKVAEAAKVIENIQRDVNIGLINEIYLACNNLNINFKNVNYLASTKWNFLNFKPGLVGGHCLPVDPYYFSYICKKKNFNTKITLAGRNINDSMTKKVINNINNVIKKKKLAKKKILICGLTYKKNVADLRNSLAFKIFKILKKKNIKGYDPLVGDKVAKKNGILIKEPKLQKFDIFFVLTNHDKIEKYLKKVNKNQIFFPI